MYAGLGGANYPSWPDSSPDGYADAAAQSLIAYAKANNLAGYDLDFEKGLNDDWVTQWTSIIPQLAVSHHCLRNPLYPTQTLSFMHKCTLVHRGNMCTQVYTQTHHEQPLCVQLVTKDL